MCDEEQVLPFPDNSFDLVTSSLRCVCVRERERERETERERVSLSCSLHWVNNLPGTLKVQ